MSFPLSNDHILDVAYGIKDLSLKMGRCRAQLDILLLLPIDNDTQIQRKTFFFEQLNRERKKLWAQMEYLLNSPEK